MSPVNFGARVDRRPSSIHEGLAASCFVPAPLVAAPSGGWFAVAEAFYRAGAMVFGGGHVVLPLLEETVVGPGWVSSDDFLAGYGALLFGRALWLGDPLSIPLHQLQNGALLIFAFFMISDPRTSPNSASGRALFGALVATVAFTIQYVFYEPNGAILALIMLAPTVPLIDRLISGELYRWDRPGGTPSTHIKGVN